MYNKNAMTNLLISEEKNVTQTKHKPIDKTCAAALVETLTELGVNSIFGYPGASVLSVYNELSKANTINHYLARHEQAAVHAAEGYARITNKPAFVIVTSGPGFTNTITGIANAYADSTPLVILAGDVPSNDNTGKVFQKVDILSLTKSCSKKNYMVTSKDDIKQVIKEAYEIANSGEKGPVVIALPRNIMESKYSAKITKFLHKKKPLMVSDMDYKKAIKLLNAAKNPLILLGGGALNSIEQVKFLTKRTNIPVVSTLMGIGAFPSENRNYLGMIGMNGTHLANSVLNNSDFILALGVSFSDRTTCRNKFFAKNAKIVNVNIKKCFHNFELNIQSDINSFLENFNSFLNSSYDFSTWHSQIKILKEDIVPQKHSSKYLQSQNVLETIYNFTKEFEPVVVTDVGQHQMLTAQFFNFNKPKKFITSGGLGTMGFGLPAAIGAQLANPNSLVLNITGDGSFQMNLQELATCREHHIPIKIIIMNNGYLGMVRQMQEKLYNNLYQVEMINPDFVKIAEAYDLLAVRVKSASELIPALEKVISHKGTAIIDIAISSNEEI